MKPAMNTAPSRRLVTVAAALLLAYTTSVGCSNDGDTQSQAPVDAGTDAPVDPNIQLVCPGACETVRDCQSTVDMAACEAQCAKELTGDGYLIPYVALPVFEVIRDWPNPVTACQVAYRGSAFEELNWSVTEDQELFGQCRAAMVRYYGGVDKEDFTHYCYEGFYRFNTPIRNEILPCFDEAAPSDTVRSCVESKIPVDPLWIAGAPYPPILPIDSGT